MTKNLICICGVGAFLCQRIVSPVCAERNQNSIERNDRPSCPVSSAACGRCRCRQNEKRDKVRQKLRGKLLQKRHVFDKLGDNPRSGCRAHKSRKQFPCEKLIHYVPSFSLRLYSSLRSSYFALIAPFQPRATYFSPASRRTSRGISSLII